MSWELKIISDLSEIPLRNGIYKEKEFQGRGQKIINMKELFGFNFIGNQEMKRVDLSDSEKERFLVKEGDLLFARRSLVDDGAGKTSIISNLLEDTTFESSMIRVRLNQKITTPLFYYYYFTSYEGRGRVLSLSTGVNVKGIKGSELNNLQIPFPPLETQKRIASILSNYDNLIENNLKRIKLLEETAQNIYKEWFVNFRFPNYEHTEFDVESGLPAGWEMKKISSIVEFKGGFPFKSSEYTESGKYRIVTIKNVGDRFFDGNNTSGIENIPDKMKEYCKLQEGNILMSLTGNIGRTCLVYGENYLLNQRVVIVTPINSENSAFCYFLFNTDSIKGLMNNLSSGVAQQNLSPVKLEEQLIPLPPMSLMLKYSSAINGIVNQIISLNKQNGKLKEARDILLPRLMNRTIEV